jgi:predicted dehydrogenase
MNEQNDKKSNIPANRRDFLRTSALISAGAWIAGCTASTEKPKTVAQAAPMAQPPAEAPLPTSRPNIACIGIGGKGDGDSTHAGRFGNIVAICDVDERSLDKKAKEFPKAKRYNDYRKMYEEMGNMIQGVTVSTPDHHHFMASMMAIKLGKNVYCQKPLTHTVAEARALREAARKAKVITQMGNQGTANSELRRGVELLRANALGAVKEVHIWTNRPVWPQAPIIMARPPEDPVPNYLNWDLWIGPAPMRPYSGQIQNNGHPPYHNFNWRGWWDFGTGALGDMGCHTANMPFMGLELGYPTSIQGECGDLNPETYPSWATVAYEFPARGSKPPLKLTWWEGHKTENGQKVRNIPGHKVTAGFDLPESGSLVIGDKGMMMSLSDYGSDNEIILNAMEDFGPISVPKTLPRHASNNMDESQKREWIAAFAGGPKPLSNFEYAGKLAEFIVLGNIAIRMQGAKLLWDGPGMKFTNNEEANQYLKTDYREGWSV